MKNNENTRHNGMGEEGRIIAPCLSQTGGAVDLEQVLRGEQFFAHKLYDGLNQAQNYGLVATMPELIAAKIASAPLKEDGHYDLSHKIWQKGYDVHTEEHTGGDKNGVFYEANAPLTVIINGGGLLNPHNLKIISYDMPFYDDPTVLVGFDSSDESKEVKRSLERIWTSTLEGLSQGEFFGERMPVYMIEDLLAGTKQVTEHNSAIIMPYELVQNSANGFMDKQTWMNDPLVIARFGGKEHLENYFDRAKHSDKLFGNVHKNYSGGDTQCSMLYLGGANDHFMAGGYGGNGRFIGMKPNISD